MITQYMNRYFVLDIFDNSNLMKNAVQTKSVKLSMLQQ